MNFYFTTGKKKQQNRSSTLETKSPVSCFESTAGGGATASDASAYARGANAAAGGGNGRDRRDRHGGGNRVIVGGKLLVSTLGSEGPTGPWFLGDL